MVALAIPGSRDEAPPPPGSYTDIVLPIHTVVQSAERLRRNVKEKVKGGDAVCTVQDGGPGFRRALTWSGHGPAIELRFDPNELGFQVFLLDQAKSRRTLQPALLAFWSVRRDTEVLSPAYGRLHICRKGELGGNCAVTYLSYFDPAFIGISFIRPQGQPPTMDERLPELGDDIIRVTEEILRLAGSSKLGQTA
jgi:hypothetical protein